MKMICADVGGTSVKAALISVGRRHLSQTYKIKKFCSVPTRSDLGFEGVRESVLKAISQVKEDDVADIVAIATAGEVDWDDGCVLRATIALPGFCGYAFSKDMSDRLGARVVVINDACAAAVCEHYFANKRARSTLVLTIGTGLGSALVTDGEIDGKHVYDLELGHREFVRDGYVCRCGNRGCLEQYLSATAIKRDAGKSTVKEAFTYTGEKNCIAAKNRFLSVLNKVATDAAAEFAPERILVGGGLAEMKNLWYDEFRARYGDVVSIARMGNKAGLLGAAYAALNGKFEDQ